MPMLRHCLAGLIQASRECMAGRQDAQCWLEVRSIAHRGRGPGRSFVEASQVEVGECHRRLHRVQCRIDRAETHGLRCMLDCDLRIA